MKNPSIYLSDLVAFTKLITEQQCKIVVFETDGLVQKDVDIKEVILVNKPAVEFFYRSEDCPILIAFNLTNQSIKDPGFDVVISLNEIISGYQQYQVQPLISYLNSSNEFEFVVNKKEALKLMPYFLKWRLNTTIPTDKLHFAKLLGINKGQIQWYIYSRNPLFINHLTKNVPFAASFNSIGSENFLYVLTAFNAPKNTLIKIPLSEAAQRANLNEWLSLDMVKNNLPSLVKVPKITVLHKRTATTQLEFEQFSEPVFGELSNEQVCDMLHFYTDQQFLCKQELAALPIHHIIKKRLERIEKNASFQHIPAAEQLWANLYYWANKMKNTHAEVYTTVAHGSFQESELWIEKEQLHINNWTKFSRNYPLFYDFFNHLMHEKFTNESNGLTKEPLLDYVEKFCCKPAIVELIKKYSLSIKLYYKLYLLLAGTALLENLLLAPNSNKMPPFWLEMFNEALTKDEKVYS